MAYATAHQLGSHDIDVNGAYTGSTITAMSDASLAGRAPYLGVSINDREEQQAARIPYGDAATTTG
jgi:hypothetical protein